MNQPRAVRPLLLLISALLFAGVFATPAGAQLRGLRKAISQATERLSNPTELLGRDPPIATSLEHATFGVALLDGFAPDSLDNFGDRLTPVGFPVDSLDNILQRVLVGMPVDSLDNFRAPGNGVAAVDSLDPFPIRDREGVRAVLAGTGMPVDSLDNFFTLRSMAQLQRTHRGGFLLQPGFWEMHTQSYCLKAGTYGPGGGDGYLYAPPSGPAEEAVMMIVRNSVRHPEIEQSQIQQLLWTIIARAKFEDLRPELQRTAARLLTPEEIALLNRSALDLVPGPVLDGALGRMPPLVQQVLRAEAELRQILSNADASFEQMERVAVLAGMAPRGEGSQDVPGGRWSRHPDGYFVRYLPRGYSYTVTQIWVPPLSPAVGREYDPATHIAVPGNTARQRLMQSGRAHKQES